jgi:hypothetical protein
MSSIDSPEYSAPSSSALATHNIKAKTGCIPINKNGHRLNKPLRIPTAAEQSALKDRTRTKKLCSPFYLANTCPFRSCNYDHTPISTLVRYALRYKMSEWPCRYGGACRRKDCFNGHLCFRKKCGEKKAGDCRFDSDMHGVDLEVAEWIESVGAWGNELEVKTTKVKHGVVETISSKGSMEKWPTMVGNLIDV